MDELRDQIVDCADVLPGVRAEIEDAADHQSRVEIMTRHLLQRMRPPRHQRAVARALLSIGGGRVSDIASRIGMTERTLERAFDACVGMSPKRLARLLRFRAAVARPDLDAGYFDESHLIRDFHEFCGTTPAEFRREQNAINEAFVGNVQASADGRALDFYA